MDIQQNLFGAMGKREMIEYMLYGTVIDESMPMLLHKLQGFCDQADVPPQPFQDHEIVYTIRLQNGPSTNLRLRRSHDCPENPLNLRYMGVPNTDAKKMVLSRTCIDCNCSHGIQNFLPLMGFVKDYEYIMKGHIFRKGGMKILVYKMFKVHNETNLPHNSQDRLEPFTNSTVVELTVVIPHPSSEVVEAMKDFAETLKPIVNLEIPNMQKFNAL